MKKGLMIALATMISYNSLNAGTKGGVEQSYDFSGFYAGFGAGIITLFTNDTFETTRSNGLGGNADHNHYTDTSILFTGNIGYNKKIRPKTYIGAKGAIYYTPINHLTEVGFSTAAGNVLIVGNNSITASAKPIYNIDAVLGYEIIPHIMPFIEAGISFSDVNRGYIFKRSRTNIATLSNVKYESGLRLNGYKTGYNVGLGINYHPHQNWFFSTELVYYDLGKSSGSVTVAIPSTSTTETQSRSIRTNSVALFSSFSYLFNV